MFLSVTVDMTRFPLFHGAEGQAAHELALAHPAENENGGDRHGGGGGELGPEQALGGGERGDERGQGAAVEVVRFRLQNASFQHRMIDSRAVEAIPGSDSGSSRFQTSCFGLAPSMRPASRISLGTSLKKV